MQVQYVPSERVRTLLCRLIGTLGCVGVAAAQPQIAGPPTVVATAGQRLAATIPETEIQGFIALVSDGPRIAANITTAEGGAIASFTPGSSTILTRLRVGPTIQPLDDHQFVKLERGFGIGASGAMVVSAQATGTLPDASSEVFGLLDTLWRQPSNGTAAAVSVRGDKFSPSGSSNSYRWTFTSSPGVTDGGDAYWIGGRSAHSVSPTNNVTLYRGGGTSPVALIGSGSGVVGGFTLDQRRPLRLAFLTQSGARVYGVFGLASTTGITAANDEIVGWRYAEVPTTLIRVLAREGDFVNGTSGERWRGFDRVVATDKSPCPGLTEWAMLARTTADSYRDAVLVVDGQIALREGDTIDGRTLLGNPKDLTMNRQGDWAVAWQVREAVPNSTGGQQWLDRNAVIVNGRTALVALTTAAGGAMVSSIDGPLCIGDREMAGYVSVGVVGTVTPAAAGATTKAAIFAIHAQSGHAGCCPADIASGGSTVEGEEPDGRVTAADLELFISRYMAADARADLDDGTGTGVADGLFTEADVNYYLNHYFTGCMEAV